MNAYSEAHTGKILSFIERIPPTDRPRAAIKMLREFYLNDFFFFAKHGLQYKDLEWEVHGQFIQVFESTATRKLVVMPRGTFKSTLGSVAYPIWRLLRNPDLTILLDSELYSNSKNFIREIKGHFESDRLINIFGNLIGPKWDEGEIIIGSRRNIRKEASITAGGLGTVKVGQHMDLIIGDDYCSAQNTETPEKCEKVINHIRYNLSILNPEGEYMFVGTRYAERDIIGYLLKEVLSENHLAEGKLKLMTEADLGADKREGLLFD